MSRIFLTSDTHFCHNRNFIYHSRGFDSVEKMDWAIVENWNKKVSPNDIVYHLGDTMLGDNILGMEYMRQLNGKIYLVRGNHDTDARIKEITDKKIAEVLGYAVPLTYKKKRFFLTHYPTLTSNYDDTPHKAVRNLHGHTHQKNNFLTENPYMYHVGVDSHNCEPVDIEEIIEDMRQAYGQN